MKEFSAHNNKELNQYLNQTFCPEDETLKWVREETERRNMPPIQVGSMDGLHLEVLARAVGARNMVEIGTLGGYSGICLMRGMVTGGKLWTLEYEPKHAELAQESFEKAGFKTPEHFEIRIGAALKKLPELEKEGPFDLVFIDADKENYPRYLKWAAQNLRQGGILLGDNTFAFGHITKNNFASDEKELKEAVEAIREFNRQAAGEGFRGTLLPTGEGLTLAVKT